MRIPRGPPRLLRVIWPFVAIVLLLAFLAGISMYTVWSVRAYVAGESIWAKGQKEAVYFLSLYAETGDENYHRRYRSAIAVPLGDLIARRALEASTPDVNVAQDGFLQGGNHPDDVGGMIWLFRNFSDVSYLAQAIEKWRATDSVIQELVDLADSIHSELGNGPVASSRVDALKAKIYRINQQITPLALAFSESLGEGSRSIKRLLTIANVFSASLLILIGVWLTRILLVQLQKFESELKTEKERAQITLASIGEAVISIDAHGCVEYMNPTAERLVARQVDDAQGRALPSMFGIVAEDDGMISQTLVEQVLAGHTVSSGLRPYLLMRGDSSPVPVSWVGTPLHSGAQTTGAVLVLHDMTQEQEYISRLAFQASHDALTGLANRRAFERRLEEALPQV